MPDTCHADLANEALTRRNVHKVRCLFPIFLPLCYRSNGRGNSSLLRKIDSLSFCLWQRSSFHTPYTGDLPADLTSINHWRVFPATLARRDLGNRRNCLDYRLPCPMRFSVERNSSHRQWPPKASSLCLVFGKIPRRQNHVHLRRQWSLTASHANLHGHV